MNTYLLRPDLHKLFGDRLASVLLTVSDSLQDSDVFPLAGALRSWTQTWTSMEKFSDRHHFQSTLFISRIAALRQKLNPMSKLLTNLCIKLEHHVIEILAREGTVGNAQCNCILKLCTCLLSAGNLMHTTCLALGSDPSLDVEAYMEKVNQQVAIVKKEALLALSRFEGTFLVKAPTEPVALAHVRAWVALFALASSFHIAVSSQPQQLITVLMDEHPSEQLIRRTKRFIRCLETLCTSSFSQQTTQQTTSTTPNITIGTTNLKNADQNSPWVELGKVFGPANPDSNVANYLKKSLWYKHQEAGSRPLADFKNNSKPTIDMNTWSYDDWVKFGLETGLTSEKHAYPDKTRFAPWQAPPNVFVGALIHDMIETERATTMSKHKEDMINLLRQNNEMNISPELRKSNEETILNLYAKAEQNSQKKLPMDPEKLKDWMRKELEAHDPIAFKLDRANLQKQPPKDEIKPAPRPVMAPMDDDALIAAFSEDLVTREDLVESIKSKLHGDFQSPPEKHMGPPPLMQATQDLLGPDPANTMAVILSSAGPTTLPVNVRALAPLVCVSMLIYPASDKLLGHDNFMSRLKECSQESTQENILE